MNYTIYKRHQHKKNRWEWFLQMIWKFQKRDSKMVHPLKIAATKSDWERRGGGTKERRRKSFIPWSYKVERQKQLFQIVDSICMLWIAHAHTQKNNLWLKNTLRGTLKESIKHFKYKILKSYMYNKSIMSYKKLNSLNKWGDNPCL